MRILLYAVTATTALIVVACNRYEVVQLPCPSAEPGASSAIAWKAISNRVGYLEVAVLGIDLRPIADAQVQVRRDSTGDWVNLSRDSTHFRIEGLAPGMYQLWVRRVGYVASRRNVVVIEGSGVRAVATLSTYQGPR